MHRTLFAITLIVVAIAIYVFSQDNTPVLRAPDETPGQQIHSTRNNPTADNNATANEDNELKAEVNRYIADILKHDDQPVQVDRADDFVGRDEPISLFAEQQYETLTVRELGRTITPSAPLTIVREQEQVELVTVKDLLADSGGDLGETVKLLQGGDVQETTVGKVVEKYNNPETPISVIKRTEHLQVTTLQELEANETLGANEKIKVIREPYRLQTTTVDELLIAEQSVSRDLVFYVRNVTEDDVQGLWGIVHNGLVKNFASGIALRRGQQIRSYQVDIPANADERLDDQSSSFLGKMIDRKTRESFVYNYKKGDMRKNPDLIIPGQEIVIVGFTPEELYDIYEHFVTRSEYAG